MDIFQTLKTFPGKQKVYLAGDYAFLRQNSIFLPSCVQIKFKQNKELRELIPITLLAVEGNLELVAYCAHSKMCSSFLYETIEHYVSCALPDNFEFSSLSWEKKLTDFFDHLYSFEEEKKRLVIKIPKDSTVCLPEDYLIRRPCIQKTPQQDFIFGMEVVEDKALWQWFQEKEKELRWEVMTPRFFRGL